MKYSDITKLKHLAQDKTSRSANPAVVRNSTVFFKSMKELLDKEKIGWEEKQKAKEILQKQKKLEKQISDTQKKNSENIKNQET